ncbi:MAG: (Fe-S)-binding protein [Methanobacterium sp.]|uniref:(Fe-S)-binding protein n=1 Tax=Methanobacterium sp. TaxID=2164 RepID=UPI00258E818B|nr:(Fe-S)-binding protein [Methanobacterium sp.]MCC7560307.1 (Fe-S)-binding protein [Methanobacterium sp.]
MIYFRGCLSREKMPEIPDTTEKILEKTGTDYRTLDNEGCCGSVLLRTGFYDDALQVMKDTLKDIRGEKILVSCAGCYRTFKYDYPDILGEDVDVIHTSHLFYDLIKEGKIKPAATQEKVTYHDPCHLGRHIGEYEIPRQVISHFAQLVEMERNQEKARCCGAGGGVRSAFPELSIEIGKMRLDEANDTGAETLVTCCPFCISNLELAQVTYSGKGITIVDLSQFMLRRLNHE